MSIHPIAGAVPEVATVGDHVARRRDQLTCQAAVCNH